MPQLKFLTEGEAAALLGMGVRNLRKLRYRNQGPAFLKTGGKVKYFVGDIDNWLLSLRKPAGALQPVEVEIDKQQSAAVA